jgi:hypothetical protein
MYNDLIAGRMHRTRVVVLWAVCGLIAAALLTRAARADDISERAHKLHFSSIVLDTHDDTTQRFFSKDYDLGKQNPDGQLTFLACGKAG